MKTRLLFLCLFIVAFNYAQELIIVDLSVTNEVTITTTGNNSAATVSGSDTTGFYLEDFFANAGTQTLGETLVVGDLTSASETPDNSPDLFRGGTGGIDAGLNIWSYTNDPTSNFTAGQLAFTGSGTWTLSTDEYNAMLTAPMTGNIFFPADTQDDIAGATLIGTYSVVTNLSVEENNAKVFTYSPNPVQDVLNMSSQKIISRVELFNMLGQNVSTQTINELNATISMAAFPAGTYFMRATLQGAETETFKLVKQ